MPRFPIPLIAACLALSGPAQARQDAATYTVRFEATWSAQTHPTGFPSDPHFSRLIGGVHSDAVLFWEPGALASSGIESMAETGQTSLLEDEILSAVIGGTALSTVEGGGIAESPGFVELQFQATAEYDRLTLVSMLAPSPDWFVGVTGLALRDTGGWIARLEVPLALYDSGTDSGTTYRATDADTQPPEPVSEMTASPFNVSNLVGRFVITRDPSTGTEGAGADVPGIVLARPWPNPVRDMVHLRVAGARTLRASLQVVDVLGRTRYRALAESDRDVTVETSAWPPGLYVVRAEIDGRVLTQPFIVGR